MDAVRAIRSNLNEKYEIPKNFETLSKENKKTVLETLHERLVQHLKNSELFEITPEGVWKEKK